MDREEDIEILGETIKYGDQVHLAFDGPDGAGRLGFFTNREPMNDPEYGPSGDDRVHLISDNDTSQIFRDSVFRICLRPQQRGAPVTYITSQIQLQHVRSGFFVVVRQESQPQEEGQQQSKTNYWLEFEPLINEDEDGDGIPDPPENSLFVLKPGNKLKTEGSEICSGEPVVLCWEKDLDVKFTLPTVLPPPKGEVEVKCPRLTVRQFEKYTAPPTGENVEEPVVRCGQTVSILMKELEGNLFADSSSIGVSSQGLFLSNTIRVKQGSCNERMFDHLFVIEKEDPLSGGPLQFTDKVRLQHLKSTMYLYCDQDTMHTIGVTTEFGLTSQRDAGTLFKLVSLYKGSTEVRFGSLFHLRSIGGRYLHAFNPSHSALESKSQQEPKNFVIKPSQKRVLEDALCFDEVPPWEESDLVPLPFAVASQELELSSPVPANESADALPQDAGAEGVLGNPAQPGGNAKQGDMVPGSVQSARAKPVVVYSEQGLLDRLPTKYKAPMKNVDEVLETLKLIKEKVGDGSFHKEKLSSQCAGHLWKLVEDYFTQIKDEDPSQPVSATTTVVQGEPAAAETSQGETKEGKEGGKEGKEKKGQQQAPEKIVDKDQKVIGRALTILRHIQERKIEDYIGEIKNNTFSIYDHEEPEDSNDMEKILNASENHPSIAKKRLKLFLTNKKISEFFKLVNYFGDVDQIMYNVLYDTEDITDLPCFHDVYIAAKRYEDTELQTSIHDQMNSIKEYILKWFTRRDIFFENGTKKILSLTSAKLLKRQLDILMATLDFSKMKENQRRDLVDPLTKISLAFMLLFQYEGDSENRVQLNQFFEVGLDLGHWIFSQAENFKWSFTEKVQESYAKHLSGAKKDPGFSKVLGILSGKIGRCKLIDDWFEAESPLKFLESVCQGHNKTLQGMMNAKNANLVETICEFLTALPLYTDYFSLISQTIKTLTEFAEGPCPQNQAKIATNQVLARLRKILQFKIYDYYQQNEEENKKGFSKLFKTVCGGGNQQTGEKKLTYEEMRRIELNSLKDDVIVLVLSLLEGSPDPTIRKSIRQHLYDHVYDLYKELKGIEEPEDEDDYYRAHRRRPKSACPPPKCGPSDEYGEEKKCCQQDAQCLEIRVDKDENGKSKCICKKREKRNTYYYSDEEDKKEEKKSCKGCAGCKKSDNDAGEETTSTCCGKCKKSEGEEETTTTCAGCKKPPQDGEEPTTTCCGGCKKPPQDDEETTTTCCMGCKKRAPQEGDEQTTTSCFSRKKGDKKEKKDKKDKKEKQKEPEEPPEERAKEDLEGNICVLLKILGDADDKSRNKDIETEPKFNSNNDQIQVGHVEIMHDNKLEKVYFPIPVVCNYLDTYTHETFSKQIDPDEENKMRDFTEKIMAVGFKFKRNRSIQKIPLLAAILMLARPLTWLLNILAIVINFLLITQLDKPVLGDNSDEVIVSVDGIFSQWKDAETEQTVLVFGYILFFGHVVSLIIYACDSGVFDIQQRWVNFQETRKVCKRKYGKVLPWWVRLWGSGFGRFCTLVAAVFMNLTVVYSALCVAFAGLGMWIQPVFFAFHLIGLFVNSDDAINVVRAVTKNGISLIWTAFLGVVAMWILSLFVFIFFNDSFILDDTTPMCQNAGDCFATILNFGIRGAGLWEGAGFPNDIRPSRILFNMAFLILINILLLNMIFGIIIDTFAQIREERESLKEKLRSNCFICGIHRSKFEREARGLDHHQLHDHNIWHYVAFIFHIQDVQKNKGPSALNGIEHYVANKMSEKNYDFFPRKALCLQQSNK